MELLEGETRDYAGLISKKDDVLRASKPVVLRDDMRSGCAAYIWRMVAFYVSPKPRHHCMPITAEFDIPLSYKQRNAKIKELDAIVDAIVDAVAVKDWHGVKRWGQVYGRIGTPMVKPDGSIVYR